MMEMKFVLYVLLAAAACSKPTPPASPAVVDPIPMPSGSVPAAASDHTAAVLAAYERTRALLAADEFKTLAAAARELESSATAATGSGPHLQDIARAAATLASARDIEAARAAFGEVSRHVIALLAADKSLAQGKHVFECPMVAGYRKWVQPSDNLENPYMGKRMLACGSESTWD